MDLNSEIFSLEFFIRYKKYSIYTNRKKTNSLTKLNNKVNNSLRSPFIFQMLKAKHP